jgi:hypothetical protein
MLSRLNKSLRILKNEKGSMLIISYFVIIILLGIGVTYMLASMNESLAAERERLSAVALSAVAFHIAEAGVERGLSDMRLDFANGGSWTDGTINGYPIANDGAYHDFSYSPVVLNGGSYTVQCKLDANGAWVKSVGTTSGATHTIEAYAKIVDLSPWNNAIFAGAGASGSMINGNVDIRGSVHILGTGLNAGDLALNMGGTAQLVGNNYAGLSATLLAKVPALPTVVHNGETVTTLNGILRVKKGIVGVSGTATVGEPNITGNGMKESVDAAYVTNGYGGNQGVNNVYSDNGTNNGYDLGDAVTFPSLNTAYPGYASYKDYLKAKALVISSAADLAKLNNITPTSSFAFSNTVGGVTNSITMDGNGNMTVSGIVYVDNNGSLNLNKAGSNKTINYTGKGSLLVTGNVGINVNLMTAGNASFPNNIVGIMTPNIIDFNEANINVMGVFYAENKITAQKQTTIMGTIVSNYFDMGTNVPAIFQVPATLNSMPPGMIGTSTKWYSVVAWIKS